MLSKVMRWRKKDELKLSRYVRKFNASITLMSRKNPELADVGLLPKKLSAQNIRMSDITRKDFNNLMARIDRWFRPGSREIIRKYGIPMTRWEYKEAVYASQRIEADRAKKRKQATKSLRQRNKNQPKMKPSEKLEKLGQKLKSGDYDAENAINSWKLFVQTVQAQSTEGYIDEKNAMYYNNYHTAIYENFSDDNAKLYADFLEDFRLTGEELFELIGEYPTLDIDYMYGPEEEENKFMYLVEMLPMAVEHVLGKDMLEAGLDRFHKRINARGTPQERFMMWNVLRDNKIKLE